GVKLRAEAFQLRESPGQSSRLGDGVRVLYRQKRRSQPGQQLLNGLPDIAAFWQVPRADVAAPTKFFDYLRSVFQGHEMQKRNAIVLFDRAANGCPGSSGRIAAADHHVAAASGRPKTIDRLGGQDRAGPRIERARAPGPEFPLVQPFAGLVNER